VAEAQAGREPDLASGVVRMVRAFRLDELLVLLEEESTE
jgi:hypothetical protein